MSLQLKKKSNTARNLKVVSVSGIIVVGASYLILNTFPHLRTSLYKYLTGEIESEQQSDVSPRKKESKDEYEPLELESKRSNKRQIQESQPSLADENSIDVASWSDANLTKWLGDKEISPPPHAPHDNLVSLVKSIQESTHEL